MNELNNIEGELQDLESTLAGLSKRMPFSVPDNYFISLPASLKERAGEVALLGQLNNVQQPMQEPAGYFETLPEQLMVAAKKTSKHQSATVIAKRINLPVIRWASAASLVFIVAFGGYIMFGNNNPPEHMLTSITVNDISEYVSGNYDINPVLVNTNSLATLNVDNTEIISYLNENGWE